MDDILSRGKLPIVAGGTGLYIDSLLSGAGPSPPSPPTAVPRPAGGPSWRAPCGQAMLGELAAADPETAARLHPNDQTYRPGPGGLAETGKTISQHNRETRALPLRYDALTLTLAFERREDMWARIDRRVDQMMADGLVEEVRALLDSGVPVRCTAMQAIGYKEMAAALRGGGDVCAAAEEIKLRSRQYAKRQLTWFRRNPKWLFWGPEPQILTSGRRIRQNIWKNLV